MSLVRLALRLCAVKALAGRTYAEDRVLDSSIVGLDSAIRGNPRPVIVVYTDSDDLSITGLDLWAPASGARAMVFLLAVASSLATAEGDVEFFYPPTDAATEFQLDMMERAVAMALLDPRTSAPWADLWRRFAVTARRWRSDRGASTEAGVRFAARQIVVDLDTLAEPIPGQAGMTGAGAVWTDFLAAVEADPDPAFAAMAAPIARLVAGDDLTERERDQMSLGLTYAGRYALGHPVPGEGLDPADEGAEPAALTELIIDPAPEAPEGTEASTATQPYDTEPPPPDEWPPQGWPS